MGRVEQGRQIEAFVNATAGGTVALDFNDTYGFNALLVVHQITGATSGGYVSVLLGGVPHHGKGSNIPDAARNTSYTALFEGIAGRVSVTLNVTDGTHTVIVIPLVV